MIFMTGGTGLIGRHTGLEPSRADLRTTTPNLEGVSTVIHLAQSRRYKDGPDGYADVWAVNTDATFRLLDAARKAGVTRFVYASSGSVETGKDMYCASKMAAEHACQAFADHLSVSVLRFYTVYGPGQRDDALIPCLVDRVRRGLPVQNGIMARPVHARDAAQAVLSAARDDITGLRTVSGPEILTAHDMARIIGKKLGREPVLEEGVPVPVHRTPDFIARIGFEEGFDDYLHGHPL